MISMEVVRMKVNLYSFDIWYNLDELNESPRACDYRVSFFDMNRTPNTHNRRC